MILDSSPRFIFLAVLNLCYRQSGRCLYAVGGLVMFVILIGCIMLIFILMAGWLFFTLLRLLAFIFLFSFLFFSFFLLYGQNYTNYQWLIIYPNVSKNV